MVLVLWRLLKWSVDCPYTEIVLWLEKTSKTVHDMKRYAWEVLGMQPGMIACINSTTYWHWYSKTHLNICTCTPLGIPTGVSLALLNSLSVLYQPCSSNTTAKKTIKTGEFGFNHLNSWGFALIVSDLVLNSNCRQDWEGREIVKICTVDYLHNSL